MSETYEKILAALCTQVSNINANLILSRALREAQLKPEALSNDSLERLMPMLERAASLFVNPSVLSGLRMKLRGLGQAHEGAQSARRITIRIEQDISDARLAARQLCDQLGARSLATQKVATTVSELARNIFSYTRGGELELIPILTPPPRIRVRAVDQGPGIADLDHIMSGRYRSKTGLGLGLIGTKRLVDHFDIQTGVDGTRVEVEVRL